ncbi:hypothetical protein [Spiroplasma endosymbiont of Villa modesta]|uniref:hypothetical protein n=1 Tax=Spiroplasma endosymbiont of Villa modesta TaxID=3066293 RepID=UPI00313DD888
MINKLWTDVSLENYNNWYPLTGKITETPQQYIKTWPNVNDWFKTFAIRAQNDINAYLDFILSKFPFDSFKDELIKETLRDMVYVMVEHWVFNRTPIEFNVDATIQFNNGTQFSANSTPTINVWDLAPSRMKIWARLTELKQIFSSYNDDEIDVEKIDLKAFYTRNQVDELIEQQKEFTLLKQIKLYDDLVDDNENEIYRGPVSKFVNKGYVATDYDKETETMILDWPDEIGTLPPEALQNNPQIGDYTHAPTCDFSAKQQKRITTNENEITKLNNELIKANENINDVKNNWFNIETSPLWKKVKNENIKTDTWYIIDWTYYFIDSKQLIISNNKLTKSNIRITNDQIEQKQIIIENIDVNIDKVTLLYDVDLIKFIATNSTKKYTPIIHNIYQYQGTGTPIEFIAEDSIDNDYYTKQETNDLLNKKQDKLIAGENIKIENNVISTTSSGGESLWEVNKDNPNFINSKDDKGISANNKRIIDVGTPTFETDATNKEYVDNKIPDLTNYYKKSVFMKGYFTYKDDRDQLWINDSSNSSLAISLLLNNTYGRLETNNKNIVSAINEINKKQVKENWKVIGKSINNRKYGDFNLAFNTLYRVIITWESPPFHQVNTRITVEFKTGNYLGGNHGIKIFLTKGLINNEECILYLQLLDINKWQLILEGGNEKYANIFSLEELQNTVKVDIIQPIKITSHTLKINELKNNEINIELPNTPTPSPSGSNWKEVGILTSDKKQIGYELIPNKLYKLTYNNTGNKEPYYSYAPKLEILFRPQPLPYQLPFSPTICYLFGTIKFNYGITGVITYQHVPNDTKSRKIVGITASDIYNTSALYKLEELQE